MTPQIHLQSLSWEIQLLTYNEEMRRENRGRREAQKQQREEREREEASRAETPQSLKEEAVA